MIFLIVYTPFTVTYLKKCKKKYYLNIKQQIAEIIQFNFVNADNLRTIDKCFLLHHRGNLDQELVSSEKSHPR